MGNQAGVKITRAVQSFIFYICCLLTNYSNLTKVDQNLDIYRIWKSFLAGDKEAFAGIYNMNLDILYRYGTKLCADEDMVKDAIQEVFLDLYLKRGKNKSNPEYLKYYLILALKRILMKKVKQNRKIVDDNQVDTLCFEPEYSIEQSIIEHEEATEITRRVGAALTKLPSKQKEALYLRFNESMDYPAIAQILEISVESVRKQVYRALKTVREIVGTSPLILWVVLSKKITV